MDCIGYPHSINTGNSNSYNVTDSLNNNINLGKVIAYESPKIMRWLSLLDSRRRNQGVRTDRLECIGDSLLETNEFLEWKSGESGADKNLLFYYGNPVVGKTFLR